MSMHRSVPTENRILPRLDYGARTDFYKPRKHRKVARCPGCGGALTKVGECLVCETRRIARNRR